MGQKESNRTTNAVFLGPLHGGSVSGFVYPSHTREDEAPQQTFPGDLAESPVPGWDNVWIDLGGEG